MTQQTTEDFEKAAALDMDGDGDYDADDQAVEEVLLKAGWEGRDGSPVKARLEGEVAESPAYPSPTYAGHTLGRVNLWGTIIFLGVTVVLLLLLVAVLGRI